MEFSNELIDIVIPVWLIIVSGFLISMFITFKAIKPIINLARITGLNEKPNARSSHTNSTPLFGGVAVFAGFTTTTVVLAGTGFSYELKYIIASLIILFFIGLKDDIFLIDPRKKLLGQIVAALIIIVLGGLRISDFFGVFGVNSISYIPSVLFTLFVFIVIINGFNLIDGIDGLASGVGILTSFTFGSWFWINHHISYSVLCFAFAGSLLAFFRFNVFSRDKKIFLGDTGSLIVGLIMAVIVTRFLQHSLDPAQRPSMQSPPAVAIGILIIPLFDTLRVFTLRVAKGRSPFKADRLHVHHRLIDLGLTHFEATVIILMVNMLFVLLAFILRNTAGEIVILTELVLATILSYIPVRLLKKSAASQEAGSMSLDTATSKGGKGGFFHVLRFLSGFLQF